MFFGIALLLPLLGSRTRQAHGLLDAVGLRDELLDQVTRLVVPGTSALFVMSASPPSGRLGVALTRHAGDTTDTVLDVSQTAGLRHAFGVDSGSALILRRPRHRWTSSHAGRCRRWIRKRAARSSASSASSSTPASPWNT